MTNILVGDWLHDLFLSDFCKKLVSVFGDVEVFVSVNNWIFDTGHGRDSYKIFH